MCLLTAEEAPDSHARVLADAAELRGAEAVARWYAELRHHAQQAGRRVTAEVVATSPTSWGRAPNPSAWRHCSSPASSHPPASPLRPSAARARRSRARSSPTAGTGPTCHSRLWESAWTHPLAGETGRWVLSPEHVARNSAWIAGEDPAGSFDLGGGGRRHGDGRTDADAHVDPEPRDAPHPQLAQAAGVGDNETESSVTEVEPAQAAGSGPPLTSAAPYLLNLSHVLRIPFFRPTPRSCHHRSQQYVEHRVDQTLGCEVPPPRPVTHERRDSAHYRCQGQRSTDPLPPCRHSRPLPLRLLITEGARQTVHGPNRIRVARRRRSGR
jgi:hypothetical protein